MLNSQRDLDAVQKQKLGVYVYGLIDPRDSKVFYVGQGNNNRVFDHFGEVDDAQTGKQKWTAKRRRIHEIWQQNLDVTWCIFRWALDGKEADHVESAILDALSQSQNGPCLNTNKGNRNGSHGLLMSEEIDLLAAQPVNPTTKYPNVFIFNITNALAKGRTPYDATRCCWPVAENFRRKDNSIAVGLSGGISRGVYSIEKWESSGEKWAFTGKEYADELATKKWLQIINSARGFWQRGGYLVAEFDGNGRYRISRGNSDHETWFPLDSDI